jgi:hypothetical protein
MLERAATHPESLCHESESEHPPLTHDTPVRLGNDPVNEADLSEEAFPEGWQLGAESWSFHRQFFVRVGRPAMHGEYTAIISQIRYNVAHKLGRYYYRVSLPDGSPLVVNGGWLRLNGVEPADWTPPPARVLTPPRATAPPEPPPQARAPPIAAPPQRQPLRASTLTLGNPAAARALSERLRRFGIPDRQASP